MLAAKMLLLDAFPSAPVTTIPAVLAAMRDIERAAPEPDGIGWFNRLYRKTTENVAQRLEANDFADPGFVRALDVVFANRYFRGVRACLAGESDAPRAWLPLVEARGRRTIAPLQFALAGMNAHINRDLAPSIVDALAAVGATSWPGAGSATKAGYDRVNDVLAATETQVKAELEGAVLAEIDSALGDADDLFALWSVRKARTAAWTWGEAMFALRAHPTLATDTLLALDRMAGLASRALLL
jgi:hypothetical protein